MYFLYDVLRCLGNCFKYLQIFYVILHLPYLIRVFFEILEEKKFNFVFKIIYLSIYLSNIGLEVRLDYDNINTILLLFSKKNSLLFSPLELYSLFFF